MSKAQRGAGYLLPEPVDGYDKIMACICVPDTLEYRAALRGALYELTKYWNWEEKRVEGQNPPVDAAHYWLETLAEGFKMPCNICELVAECIENMEPGDPLYQALQDWLIDQVTTNPAITDIIGNGGDGATPHPAVGSLTLQSCDASILFGFTRQMVQYLNRRIVDVFERIEVYTNFVEFLAAVTSETTYVGAIIEYVEKLQETFMENYVSAYTAELEQEMACELMCLALQNNCQLTWEDMTGYFLENLFLELADNDIFDLLSVFASGVWDGNEFVYLMMATVTGIVHFGGEWGIVNTQSVQNIWASLTNDPDDDWQTLCSCGYSVYYETSYENLRGWTEIQGAWLPPDNPNFYTEIVGSYNKLEIERTFSPTFDGLTRITIPETSFSHNGGSQSGAGCYLVIHHSGGQYQTVKALNENGYNFELPSTLDGVGYISIKLQLNNQGDVGAGRIGGARLIGSGDSPPPDPS